jgi:hypothetical protein
MRKQVKIWVMISDPNGETRVVPFTAPKIEKCMANLKLYLDTYTGPGTTTEVIETGYIYTGASHGVQRKNSKKGQQSVESE